jgi:hypothetical protein
LVLLLLFRVYILEVIIALISCSHFYETRRRGRPIGEAKWIQLP